MTDSVVITVVNLSTVVKTTDVLAIVTGINRLLPTFCADWGLPPTLCILGGIGKPVNGRVVYVVDDMNTPVPADETRPAGRVPAVPILDNGGALFLGATDDVPTVAQFVSHEVFEMAADVSNTMWWRLDATRSIAAEVVDPVQGNLVRVQFGPHIMGLSDWVLPAWKNVDARAGPYNHNNTLPAPFIMEKTGYMIRREAASATSTPDVLFGEKVPAWIKALKLSDSRVVQRL